MALVGGIARYAFSSMMKPVYQIEGLSGVGVDVLLPNSPFSGISSFMLNIPTAAMVLGILVMVAGAVLTLLLWRERKKNP